MTLKFRFFLGHGFVQGLILYPTKYFQDLILYPARTVQDLILYPQRIVP